MKNKNLTVVIIARDAEKIIGPAIKSARFANQVLVYLDSRTEDDTAKIAKKMGGDVVPSTESTKDNFAKWRTDVLSHVKTKWVFYLDADERFTPELTTEINNIISDKKNKTVAYAVPRQNLFLGKKVKYGGSWPDYVERLFLVDQLKKWQGELHERPVYEGKLDYLKNPLIHDTHRSLTTMLEKTIKWTKTEAQLIYASDHPPIVWWRILRMMFTKFWQRLIKQKAWKDGTVGWINSIFEVFNTFIIYARVWEMQQDEKSNNK